MAAIPKKTGRLVVSGLGILVLLWAGLPSPAQAQDLEVNSADPDSAEQATVNLDVTIHGNGFAKGAVAEFLLTGTPNPGGIVVNRTTFKGPKKLIANIDIDEEAVVGGFDIEVTSNGRTGKGIDAFSVLEKGSGQNGGPTPVTVTYLDRNFSGMVDIIQSDGGAYSDDDRTVRAAELGSGGKLRLDTRGKSGGRELFLDFFLGIPVVRVTPNGPTGFHAVFMVIAPVDCTGDPALGCPDLDGGFRAITSTGLARLVLNFEDPFSSGNFRLRMGPNPLSEPTSNLGTDYLVVSCTPLAGSCTTWSVAANDPNDVARLFLFTPRQKGNNATITEVGDFNMPHGLTIETQQP